eukprot:TRINITY_DN13599_c0_g1_i1.p2 TRINITY_DN13599_c0_g1~~TRINITY_DN13599_c0_g1_i1.p2  ORF type:complete len:199 (-),score=39.78 TRINITY_DN13599_c0_g1_i1:311-907(-)
MALRGSLRVRLLLPVPPPLRLICCWQLSRSFVSAAAANAPTLTSATVPGAADAPEATLASEGLKLAVVARTDLKMSPGKLAAQVGHAVHEAVMFAVRGEGQTRLAAWEDDGAKIVVLQADGEKELRELRDSARAQAVAVASVRDAGRTEVDEDTWTVLAVGPDEETRVNGVTGNLAAYRAGVVDESPRCLRDAKGQEL